LKAAPDTFPDAHGFAVLPAVAPAPFRTLSTSLRPPPPCPPLAVARHCSDTSPVLHNHPTPRRHACFDFWLMAFSSQGRRKLHDGRRLGHPVPVRGVSMHARGLRLRGVQRILAVTHPPVLPSTMRNDVRTPVAIISQLYTLPALPLSTLRWQPYGWPRMTRVQDGSLRLPV